MNEVSLIDGPDGVLNYVFHLRSTLGLTEYDIEQYKTNLRKNINIFRKKLDLKTFSVKSELEKRKTGPNFLSLLSLIVCLSEIRMSDAIINLNNDLIKGKKRTKSLRKIKKSISFLASLKGVVNEAQIDFQIGLRNSMKLLETKDYSSTGVLLENIQQILNNEKLHMNTPAFLYYNNLIKESMLRLTNKERVTAKVDSNKSVGTFQSSYNELRINLRLLKDKIENKQGVNNEILLINNHIGSLLEVLEPLVFGKKTKLEANALESITREINYLKFLRLININLETVIQLKDQFGTIFDQVSRQALLNVDTVSGVVDMSEKLFNNIKDNYLDVDLSSYIRGNEITTEDLNESFTANKNCYKILLKEVFDLEEQNNRKTNPDINLGNIYGLLPGKLVRTYMDEFILDCNFYKEVANALVLFKKKRFKEAISEMNILLEEDAFGKYKKERIIIVKKYILRSFCAEKITCSGADQPIVFNQLFNDFRKKLKLPSVKEIRKEISKSAEQTNNQEESKKWYKFW